MLFRGAKLLYLPKIKSDGRWGAESCPCKRTGNRRPGGGRHLPEPVVGRRNGPGSGCPRIVSKGAIPAEFPAGADFCAPGCRPLRQHTEFVGFPGGQAGGVPNVLFPEIRHAGQGTQGSNGRSGRVRYLCPCGFGTDSPGCNGQGRFPRSQHGRNFRNRYRPCRGIRAGAVQYAGFPAAYLPVPAQSQGTGDGSGRTLAGTEGFPIFSEGLRAFLRKRWGYAGHFHTRQGYAGSAPGLCGPGGRVAGKRQKLFPGSGL